MRRRNKNYLKISTWNPQEKRPHWSSNFNVSPCIFQFNNW